MALSLLIGAAIGFVLASPPGPIAVHVIRKTLEDEIREADRIGWGSAFADFVYCLAILLATSTIHGTVSNIFTDWPISFFIFQLTCIIAMLGFGIVNLRKQRETKMGVQPNPVGKGKILQRIASHGPFFVGVGLAIANLANPTFIPSLTYLIMVVYQYGFVESYFGSQLSFATGFGLGTLAWMILLVRGIKHYRKRMSPQFLERIYQFAGITFIGFGTYLGYRVFAFTKWADILRIAVSF
jgi:threonine/homoserine/homoserine lactone efflux protein